jgi:hypothetical protein
MISGFPLFPILRGSALFLFVVGSAGCSSAPRDRSTTFQTTPYLIATSSSGALSVGVSTSPQPPERGTIAVELTFMNVAGGAPVDGLTLQIRPWMPAHGHGTAVVPVVTAKGQGQYIVDNVNLFMAGHWELQTTLSGSAVDYVAPALDIP